MASAIENDALAGYPVAKLGRQLPVLRHDPIPSRIECHGRTHNGRFLTDHGRESAKFALALQTPTLGVKRPPNQHVAQGFEHQLVVESGLGTVEQVAVFTENPVGFNRRFAGRELGGQE